MKKNVIAIVAAVALVLLAVPTIAFANGMQQNLVSVRRSRVARSSCDARSGRQRRRRDAIIVATGQHRHIGRRQILEGFTDNGLLIDAHIGLLT